MSTPKRIQLSRRAGFRLPPDTVSVARPHLFGNPFRVTALLPGREHRLTHQEAVDLYRQCTSVFPVTPDSLSLWRAAGGNVALLCDLAARGEMMRSKLGGKNLACFCNLDWPCHADVLLELANPKEAA